MKWHIGQKVICIKTHSQSSINGVVKGRIFTIRRIADGCCNLRLDLGLMPSEANILECICGKKTIKTDNTRWIADYLFAPLQTEDELSELTVEEILEEEVTV